MRSGRVRRCAQIRRPVPAFSVVSADQVELLFFGPPVPVLAQIRQQLVMEDLELVVAQDGGHRLGDDHPPQQLLAFAVVHQNPPFLDVAEQLRAHSVDPHLDARRQELVVDVLQLLLQGQEARLPDRRGKLAQLHDQIEAFLPLFDAALDPLGELPIVV